MLRRLAPVLLITALLMPLAAPMALAQPPSDNGTVTDPDGQPGATSTSTSDPVLLITGSSSAQAPAPVTPELGLIDLLLVTVPRLLFPFLGI